MADSIYAIKNNSNYIINSNRLYEIGRNRRKNNFMLSQVTDTGDYTKLGNILSGGVTAAIKSDTTLWVNGYGDNFSLGFGDRNNRSSPTQVIGTGWKEITFGRPSSSGFGVGIKNDGRLWAFGASGNGQGGLLNVNTVTQVTSIAAAGWDRISCGYNHTVVIQTNGSLWTWGFDNRGQCGLNTTLNAQRSTPVQIGSSTWKEFSTGTYHTVAIQTNGTLWAWGGNSFGALGTNSSTQTNISSPVQIGALSNWSQVACGYFYTTAIKTDGTLWAWGRASNGQLGQSDTTNRSSPTQVGTLSDWSQISAGFSHVVAIKTNGTLWGFGQGSTGALGINTGFNYQSPIQISPVSNWSQVRGSNLYTVALNSDGNIFSCGSDTSGQLGYNSNSYRLDANPVGTSNTWVGFPTGSQNSAWSAALNTNGMLYLFGDNSDYLMKYDLYGSTDTANTFGFGETIISPVPLDSTFSQTIKASSIGDKFGVFIKNDNTLWAWGNATYGQMGVEPSTPFVQTALFNTQPVKQVSGGAFHTAIINSNGTLWSQGLNNFGQLGLNNLTNRFIPAQVGSANNWSQSSAGHFHTAAINSSTELYVWGNNSFAQLGQNNLTHGSSPIIIGSVINLWKQVSGGEYHRLAIQSNGTLWAWGNNTFGQLGLSDTTTRYSPVQIGTVSTWSKIVAGGYAHMLAINSNGTLWAWGLGQFGALGLSDTTARSSPVQVGTLSNWSNIAAGYIYTAAIKTDGTLWTWGYNAGGQLGLSDIVTRSSPVQVGALSDWSQVACGYRTTAAIKTNGTLWTWGNNSYGQLGLGNLTNSSSPVQVGTLSDWSKVSCGYFYTTAIKTNGTLWTWGNNSFGQLGLSDLTNRSSPVQVGTESYWSSVASIKDHTVALQSNGTLWTWGNGGVGRLGQSDLISRSSPVQVGGLNNWSSISTGYFSTAAIQSDGTLWAWGNNTYGELGQNNNTPSSSPVQVGWYAPANNWTQVSSGQAHTYAVNSGGTLWAMGSNSFGQLGTNNRVNASTPIQVGTMINTWSGFSIGGAAEGSAHLMAIKSDGTLWGSGFNAYGGLGVNTTLDYSSPIQVGQSLWKQVSVGYAWATAAINSNGTLWTWGFNNSGQLGTSDTLNKSTPIQIGSSLWKNVACGYYSTFAVQTNGTLWAWGLAQHGALGLSNLTNRSSPVQVGTLSNWSKVSSHQHTLVIKDDGSLWSFGKNNYGQLGLNTTTGTSSPLQVGLSSWKIASAGREFSMAIRSDDTLWGWGGNGNGQLGLSNSTFYSSPVQVGADTWKHVSCGYNYTLAIRNNGTLWTWGANFNFQLGLNTTVVYNLFSPVQIGTLTNWSLVKAGERGQSAALNSNGYLYTWGGNAAGELGFADKVRRSAPALIGNGFFTNVSLINSGANHTTAIRNNGTLWTWGANSSGQLGLGFTSPTYDPTQVGTSTAWTNASGGFSHSAAINSGYLYAWGSNVNGQLGQNNLVNYSSPVIVGLETQVWNHIDTNGLSTLAIDNSNKLYSFGSNIYAQLGLLDTTNRSRPTLVDSLSNWNTVSVGNRNAMAIKTNGTLWVCGTQPSGQYGSLGLNTNTALTISSFVQIGSLSDWSQVSCARGNGGYSNFAIKTNGTLWACGYNSVGQIGNNSNSATSSFVQIGSLSNWSRVSAGPQSTVAIKTDGTLWTWGSAQYGQLGLNTSTAYSSPVQVGTLSNWSAISSGSDANFVVALQSNGTLWTWGRNNNGQLGLGDTTDRSTPVQVGTLSGWSKISTHYGVLALKSDGTAWAWGKNSNGQLGLFDLTNRSSPVQVGTLSNWSKIFAGTSDSGEISFFIDNSNTPYSCGLNNRGQLGQNNTTSISSPVQVGYGLYSNWSQVACGYNNTVALQSNGTLWAMGLNSYGVLAQANQTSYSIPVQIGTLSNWSIFPTNIWQSMFAADNTGKLYSWGNNTYGQLGRANSTVYSPIQVATTSNWNQVVTGLNHTLLIDNNNALWSMGSNAFGQLGLSDTTNRFSPTQIGSLTNWSQINAGQVHSVAIQSNGTLWAWGNNSYGQLGQADLTHRSSPVQVGLISTYTSVYCTNFTTLANLL